MGGSDQQVIQATAPDVQESSESLYQSRLKYDPLIAQQTQDIQAQMLPQQTELQTQLLKQYYPQLAQLYTNVQGDQAKQLKAQMEALNPTEAAVTEAGAQKALSALSSENYVTPEQQMAIDAIRDREAKRVALLARGRGQLGGQLYGGQSEALERSALNELMQGYAQQDVNNYLANQSQAFQQAQPFINILYPQSQTAGQVNTSPFQYEGVTPSADTYYSALANLAGQQTVVGAQSSPLWGLAGSALGAAGTAASGFSSKRYKEKIKLWGKPSTLSQN